MLLSSSVTLSFVKIKKTNNFKIQTIISTSNCDPKLCYGKTILCKISSYFSYMTVFYKIVKHTQTIHVRKIFRKLSISYPLIRKHTCA